MPEAEARQDGRAKVRLLAIGDIAWDIIVRPAADLVWGSDTYGTTELLAGGSSANVAVWARRLGAHVTLVGKVGNDALGELMRRHLEREGLASGVTIAEDGETTRIAIVVRQDGERAFVTDHTTPIRLDARDLPLDLLDRADVVYLNGYSVFMAGSAGFAAPLLNEARRRQLPVAFDPSSFALVSRYGPRRLLDELGPLDVLLANEEEARTLAGGSAPESLLQRSKVVVVKRGGRGARALVAPDVGSAGQAVVRHEAPAVPVEAVDTTGAGDAFDAAFLTTYFGFGDIARALAEANALGSRVAGCLGAQTAPYPAPTARR